MPPSQIRLDARPKSINRKAPRETLRLPCKRLLVLSGRTPNRLLHARSWAHLWPRAPRRRLKAKPGPSFTNAPEHSLSDRRASDCTWKKGNPFPRKCGHAKKGPGTSVGHQGCPSDGSYTFRKGVASERELTRWSVLKIPNGLRTKLTPRELRRSPHRRDSPKFSSETPSVSTISLLS